MDSEVANPNLKEKSTQSNQTQHNIRYQSKPSILSLLDNLGNVPLNDVSVSDHVGSEHSGCASRGASGNCH
jgi:hypothetical protein